MLILSFDTCLDKTYVVLRKDSEIIDSRVILSDSDNYHSAYLITTISKVLNDNGYLPKDIDGISIDVGPGSFTGIRACTTVARTMAQQLGIKGLTVSSLEILSEIDKSAIVVLDARKNSAYAWDKELIGVKPIEEVKELVKDRLVITDKNLYEVLIPTARTVIKYEEGNYELGRFLSNITERKLSEFQDWNELKPLYIQPPSISVKKGN